MAQVQRHVSSEHNRVRRNITAPSDPLAPPYFQPLRTSAERLVPQEGLCTNVCACRENNSRPCASCGQYKGIMRTTWRGSRADVDHHLTGPSPTSTEVKTARTIQTLTKQQAWAQLDANSHQRAILALPDGRHVHDALSRTQRRSPRPVDGPKQRVDCTLTADRAERIQPPAHVRPVPRVARPRGSSVALGAAPHTRLVP